MLTYKLVWDDFCSWYLEMVKPAYQQPIDTKTFETTVNFLDDLLKLLHPFMPFLSEELWHELKQRAHDLIVTEWPKAKEVNHSLLNDFEVAAEVISGIRNIRKQKSIPNKETIDLSIKANAFINKEFDAVIVKLGNLSPIQYVTEKVEGAFLF